MEKEKLEKELAEAKETITELEQKVDDLETELDCANDELEDLRVQVNKFEEYDGIKDMDNFIWRLKQDNLYTEKLEEFIKNYFKWHND